jgi:hypothetical protein
MARVDGKSTIKSDDGSSIFIMDQQFPAEINGSQEGHYEIDLGSGMLSKGHSSLEIKGSLQIMGKEVPIKVRAEKTITGREL